LAMRENSGFIINPNACVAAAIATYVAEVKRGEIPVIEKKLDEDAVRKAMETYASESGEDVSYFNMKYAIQAYEIYRNISINQNAIETAIWQAFHAEGYMSGQCDSWTNIALKAVLPFLTQSVREAQGEIRLNEAAVDYVRGKHEYKNLECVRGVIVAYLEALKFSDTSTMRESIIGGLCMGCGKQTTNLATHKCGAFDHIEDGA